MRKVVSVFAALGLVLTSLVFAASPALAGSTTCAGYTVTSADNAKWSVTSISPGYYVITATNNDHHRFDATLWLADNNITTVYELDINGGQGNDIICGASHTANSSFIPDNIDGYYGQDIIRGGAGADFLKGSYNDDNLDGGQGNDLIWGGNQNDILRGGDGNDRIDVTSDGNSITGAGGADSINGDAGTDRCGLNTYETVVCEVVIQ